MARNSTSFSENNTASRGSRRRIFSEAMVFRALERSGEKALKTLEDIMETSKREDIKLKASDCLLKHTLLLSKDGLEYQMDALEEILEKHGFSLEETLRFKEEFRLLSVSLMRDIAVRMVATRVPSGAPFLSEIPSDYAD